MNFIHFLLRKRERSVTFFNVVVRPGHRTVSRVATCWAGWCPGPTISIIFASLFKTRQINIGTAAPEFSWPTELSRISVNVNQWIYLFCFFYLQVVSVLRAADYSSTGISVGWSSVGRPRNLVVVISQVTATVDWSSLFTSSFRADMCWISVWM